MSLRVYSWFPVPRRSLFFRSGLDAEEELIGPVNRAGIVESERVFSGGAAPLRQFPGTLTGIDPVGKLDRLALQHAVPDLRNPAPGDRALAKTAPDNEPGVIGERAAIARRNRLARIEMFAGSLRAAQAEDFRSPVPAEVDGKLIIAIGVSAGQGYRFGRKSSQALLLRRQDVEGDLNILVAVARG